MKKRFQVDKVLSVVALTTAVLTIEGCGDDDRDSAREAVTATNEAVANRASELKKSASDQNESSPAAKAELQTRLAAGRQDLVNKVGQLDLRYATSDSPTVLAARQARLQKLKSAINDLNTRIENLKNSSDTAWKANQKLALDEFEATQRKVDAELNREKYENEVQDKFNKVQTHVKKLKVQADAAANREKEKFQEAQTNLNQKYLELKDQFHRFQASTEERWDDFKTQFDNLMSDLSQKFKGVFE